MSPNPFALNEDRRERRTKRRENEFRHQIYAHGGSGLRSSLDLMDALRRGVCPKCSGTWKALHTHVWKHYPPLSMADGILAFRKEFNIPNDVPIVSGAFRAAMSKAKLKQMRGEVGQQVKARIAATLSRSRPDLYGKTGPNPSGWNPSNWAIAKCRAAGMTHEQIARELGGADNYKVVWGRSKSMGLPLGKPCLCDQSEPFRYANLRQLQRASGLPTAEFEGCVGLDKGRTNNPPGSVIGPDEANKAIAWRDGSLTALLSAPSLTVYGKGYRKDAVFLTLLPKFAEANRALMTAIEDIRKTARNHPKWSVEELGEEICRMAARERDMEDDSRRRTLRYLSEKKSEAWLAANLARLRGTENSGPLVRDLIGARYGATQQTVQSALRSRTTPIAPAAMLDLLKKYAPELAKLKSKIGRRKGSTSDTEERIRRAAGLERADWIQRRMAPYVFWNTASSCQANIRPFLSANRNKIDAKKQTLTPAEVEQIVREATESERS